MEFTYVYILQSQQKAEHFYVGFTEDLRARLKKHNNGEVPHAAKFRPCLLIPAWAISKTA
jgi:predicted GIY-YIG superfamily endonuclease